MSFLGGNIFTFQADRGLVLQLIEANMTLLGNSLIPPFELSVGKITLPFTGSLPRVDLVVSGIDLVFEVGTNLATLNLALSGAVIRLDKDTVATFQTGTLKVALMFVDGTLMMARQTGITIDLPVTKATSEIPDFGKKANAEVAAIFDPKQSDTKLFPEGEGLYGGYLIFGGTIRSIDSETVAVFSGPVDFSKVQRIMKFGDTVALGVSADQLRSSLLARALLPPPVPPAPTPGVLDPLTPGEISQLPAPMGTGYLDKSQGGTTIHMTRMDFTFQEGHIDVSGNFDASDTCWSVKNGTFTQSLFLDFASGANPNIIPRLVPDTPNLAYHADVDFLCKLAVFIAGTIMPFIGSVVLGWYAVLAVNFASEKVKPSIPNQKQSPSAVPVFDNIDWGGDQVHPEGLILTGSLQVFLPSPATGPSVTFKEKSKPIVLFSTSGTATLELPTCSPQQFDYTQTTQDNFKILAAVPKLLIPPIDYEWSVNGDPLPLGSGTLTYTGTVIAAMPPPMGTTIEGHTIFLAYENGSPGILGPRPSSSITLTSKHFDFNYDVSVGLSATDATGRVVKFSRPVHFIDDVLELGPDWDLYKSRCLGNVVKIGNGKQQVNVTIPPGVPQEDIGDIISIIEQHMKAGNNETVATLIPAAVKAYGVTAVTKALNKVRV